MKNKDASGKRSFSEDKNREEQKMLKIEVNENSLIVKKPKKMRERDDKKKNKSEENKIRGRLFYRDKNRTRNERRPS